MVDVSPVDLARMAQLIPEGVKPGSDTSSLVTATVTGLDIPAGLVQVAVSGSDPLWVPAAPFIYEAGARVRVRRSPLDGNRFEYCEGPVEAAAEVVTGTITSVGVDTVTVDVLGGLYSLPFVSSTYAENDTVLVLRHATGFGVPQAVLGLAGTPRPATPPPPAGEENPGVEQSRQATIGPQDTGSYRTSFGRWDSWDTNRYGGVRALWQGNQYGSGPMVGWAGYGDQVANLRADSIEHIWVDLIRSYTGFTDPRTVVLIGTSEGTRPAGGPSGSGATASGVVAVSSTTRVRLPDSTYEAWRTGVLKGIALAGSDYVALFGADRGGAMVLTVQYKVTV